MSLLNEIYKVRKELKPSQRKIIDFYLREKNEALRLTISKVADATNSSVASINRMIKKLGFQGYKQFVLELTSEFTIKPDNVLPVFMEDDSEEERIHTTFAEARLNLELTEDTIEVDQLKRIASWIRESNRIVFIGAGGSGSIAEWAQIRFANIGIPGFFYRDFFQMIVAAGHLDRKSLLIGLTHSGRNIDILRIMEIARKTGSRIVSLTNYPEPDITRLSDIVVLTNCQERQMHLAQSNSSISMICVLDSLYFLVTRTISPESKSNLSLIETNVRKYIRP